MKSRDSKKAAERFEMTVESSSRMSWLASHGGRCTAYTAAVEYR